VFETKNISVTILHRFFHSNSIFNGPSYFRHSTAGTAEVPPSQKASTFIKITADKTGGQAPVPDSFPIREIRVIRDQKITIKRIVFTLNHCFFDKKALKYAKIAKKRKKCCFLSKNEQK